MTEEQANLTGRTFRHFKGNLYRLEGFAKDSETLEETAGLAYKKGMFSKCTAAIRG